MSCASIGHHRRGSGRMYAVVSDTQLSRKHYPGASWNAAYDDVRRDLTVRGFTWMPGSTYLGDVSIDAVRCVRTAQRLARKHQWFTPSIRDSRMLRIEENNDLRIALDDDDE